MCESWLVTMYVSWLVTMCESCDDVRVLVSGDEYVEPLVSKDVCHII